MIEGRTIDVDGINTYYIDVGEGPTIVLVHGAGATSDAYGGWAPQLKTLSKEFRVVAFDEIGFGRTDMPKDKGYYNRLERVDHAIGFMRAMGIEGAALVGHSEGAFMVARMAIVAPELCSHLILVTTGGTSPRLGGDRDNAWIEAANTAYNWDSLNDVESCIQTYRHLAVTRDPEGEAYLREAYKLAVEAGRVEIFQNMPETETNYDTYLKLQEEYIHPYLKDLKMPALLVWATEDKTVPVERGLMLLELIPDGEMHIFTDAAHMVMYDRADEFNSLLASFCRP